MSWDEVERTLEETDPWCLDGGTVSTGAFLNMGGNYLFLKSRVVVRYNRRGKVEEAIRYEPDKQRWPYAPAERVIPLLIAEKQEKAAKSPSRP